MERGAYRMRQGRAADDARAAAGVRAAGGSRAAGDVRAARADVRRLEPRGAARQAAHTAHTARTAHAGRTGQASPAGRSASRYAFGSAAVDFDALERAEEQAGREGRAQRKARLRAHDGAGRGHVGISYTQSLLFKAVIACAALIAAAAFVSVWMNASTLQTMANTEQLAGQIKSAQAATTNLELEHAQLTSPARLEAAAAGLGMRVDTDADFMQVDAVPAIATFPNGKISISATIDNARAAAACG